MEPNNSRLAIFSEAPFIELVATFWNFYAVQNLPSRNEVYAPMLLNVRYRYTFIIFIFITIAGMDTSATLLALSWQGDESSFHYLLLKLPLWSMLREVGFDPTYPSYAFLTGRKTLLTGGTWRPGQRPFAPVPLACIPLVIRPRARPKSFWYVYHFVFRGLG